MSKQDSKRDEPTYNELHLVEQEISGHLLTSATSAWAARKILGLEGDVSGLRILDLAGGASNLTADLVRSGADAQAVDLLYGDKDRLIAVLGTSTQMVIDQTPENLKVHMGKAIEQAARDFMLSYESEPNRYHPGWLTNLPFPDNSFDVAVSLNAISDLAKDFGVFRKVVMEAIRVIRPDGLTLIAPFHSVHDRNKSTYSKQHWALVRDLKKESFGEILVIGPRENYWDSVLRIRKY